jgi:hypothetical protein
VKTELTLSFDVDLRNITTFSDIARQVGQLGLDKAAFVAIVDRLDDIKTEELAGPRYERGEQNGYSRAGTAPFSVLTDFGRIPLKLNRIGCDSPDTGGPSASQTVLSDLVSGGDVQLTEEFKAKLRQIASHTTYRRATEIVSLLVGSGLKKDVVWDVVQELGIPASMTYDVNPDDFDLVLVDGSGGIGVNSKTGEMFPLHHSVQVPLAGIRKELEDRKVITKKHVIVADGETGIHRQFKGYRIQMCAFHLEKGVCYKLWQDGMSLSDRRDINKALRQILNTLKKSVEKNAGRNPGRLKNRIKTSQDELKTVAAELGRRGYSKAERFIGTHIDTVTCFANEALSLVKVPWTNNIMERFIGEVAFRIKHVWAHWGSEGLNNIIYLVMNRYCGRNRVVLEF